MAVHKDNVSFFASLLVLGLMFLHVSAEIDQDRDIINPKPCTRECGNFSYAICPRSEGSPRTPICTTCCAGYKGCKYYNANGTFICEGQSDPRKPNEHCPKECDRKIAYSKCPRSEGPTKIIPTKCTTCCTGYKGCYYYGKDNKFVCEGQSNEPKVCTQQCDPKVAYMTCPPESTKLTRVCVNCCTAKPGCKLYGHDGSLICIGGVKPH
ncbi:proteinase inhibitor type-2-like isoform X2 [Solanum pennellii]|uniref:Proteinase inhibitor type-2-like isoform X2 n=1 Tax=Solanum pennellii TaxID=28526 RepID=A0ABM1GE83_SOLPN|nr:proteinase inhibitor type-2-like isoform X2 [Solanum pennellii]